MKLVKKIPYFYNKLKNSSELESEGGFRIKRMFLATLSSFFSKGINILVVLVSVPLTLKHLGEFQYGLLMSMVSIINLLNYSDFGLGMGLQNSLAELSEKGDKLLVKKYISSTFFILCLTTVVCSLFFLIIHYNTNWLIFFNVKEGISKSEVDCSILSLFICVVISIPFSLAQRIQEGYQEGHLNQLWGSVGNIISFLLLLLFVRNGLGISYVILALFGSTLFSGILNFIFQFFYKRPENLPSICAVDINIILPLLKKAFNYFSVQIAAIVLFSSDNFLIQKFLTSQDVTMYAILFRLLFFVIFPLNSIFPYFLNAINDAEAKKDTLFVQKSIIISFKIVTIYAFLSSGLFFIFCNTIIYFWIGYKNYIPQPIVIAFSILILLYACVGSLTSFIMLSTNLIKYKVRFFCIAVLFSIIAKYYFISGGLIYIFLGTALPMLVLFVLPSLYIIRKFFFIRNEF